MCVSFKQRSTLKSERKYKTVIMAKEVKHNLSEEYLSSLSDEERTRQMEEWTATEWGQYYCPNGTMTLEEFRAELYKAVDEMIQKKYGSDDIDDIEE